MHPTTWPPTVLCVGGHDPSGGAGILADAEAVRAAGAFALTVVTALTDQDTCGLRHLYPQPAAQVEAQCRALIADGNPRAIKIGLIGDERLVPALCAVIDANPQLPVVLDPVLASGAGQRLGNQALIEAILGRLLPRITLVTPNLPEARQLSGAVDAGDCARHLLALAVPWVLITGTHAESADVTNRLYGVDGSAHTATWPRLPADYHGSGCTLASAIAARLALGVPLPQAVAAAQAFTWSSLAHAWRTGRCQLTPNRLYALPADPPPGLRAPGDQPGAGR
ncbi:bifunctional hydroxymethylpyrimidine kinase/phosphomethylpyrimidine kinase [Lamprocystis purpurea]|jgi:hydroxymethylpyrimidine/phosphomethylpyrimidine kinase|uniref:bifunctional hydroxymethylpyrimidine kinase/phosphomethylpyrimidine kinase n=1 Tax=Lamprocystis purpurea TaxID=61598 RepID=UPI0003751AB4|nr:hydroxymethylpyrimidine/phosphomethylpyrimidine kinase [Lamprocystis purpurea]